MDGPPDSEQYAYDPSIPAPADDESEDDYDPSNFLAGATASASSPPNIPPVKPEAADANGSSVSIMSPPPDHGAEPSTTNGSLKQPRTVGGFVVDDEDDEEDANGLNGSLSTTGTTQVAQAADNTFSTSEQSIEKATQNTGVAAPAHSTVGAATAAHPISTSSLRSPVSNASASGYASAPLNLISESSAPLSKTRLPQDRVGILEDRIAEDPRGDVEAWLNLIADYRAKNKFDDARKVYERFFQVFPSAVSAVIFLSIHPILIYY